ncbi:MAG TPA: acyl-CoA dehydrogenase family protein, partial [Thermoanaerobaculia bacterium]|nr:acyl-CoA dehydrogenase family protein [Thermoanaerobaculia bacterium]
MIPAPPGVSYWEASPHFQRLCRRALDDRAWHWAEPQLVSMGERAATYVAPRAQTADRECPRLVTHDERGNRINRVDYHPSYREMERVAYGSGMIAMKYSAHEHTAEAPFVSFALGYLFAMAEMGLYCPLCMTDGVARVLTRHGTSEQIERVVPHLASTDPDQLWTGGMFLTERAGGSDVAANETTARRNGTTWLLSGQKWFCSNVDAQAVLVTGKPEGAAEGIRGIRTYLLLTRDNPGVTIERLKEKLGVRSMPTGEVTLRDAPAEEIGDFRAIAEMMNLSRLYNAVAAVAVIGRAIHEARWYVERRRAFGRRVVEFPLVAETLLDLEAEHLGALLLTFDCVDALRRADAGDGEAARLLRILTPIAKAVTGKLAVPCVSECMELIGGNGYIEEWPMPRLLRDAQVLPIWEGTTNILVLDTLRVARKERSHELLLSRIRSSFPARAEALESSLASLEERQARRWVDDLARAYEITLLVEAGQTAAAERLR